jgi:general secretion pathway protein G
MFPFRSSRGFTILEMLIVLAIIGMLIGLVGNRVFSQGDAAKVDITKARMMGVQQALMTFRLDVNRVPTTQEGLTALVRKPADPAAAARWRVAYTDEDKLVDAWDKPLIYVAPGANGNFFSLSSLGADGKVGGEGVDADIVMPANSAGTSVVPTPAGQPATPSVPTPAAPKQ